MRSQVTAFVVVPAITALSVASGPNGTTITITGTRLVSDRGPTIVVLGDRPLAPDPGGTDTQIDVTVAGFGPATYPLSVRVNGAESIDRIEFEVTP